MNISDELERILGDMDEDERKKADESNVAKQMALLAAGGSVPTGTHQYSGGTGFHQPGSLEANMLMLGGHRAIPMIMALHKASGGAVDKAEGEKPANPQADDSGGLFDPEMFGVPTGIANISDALEREYQSAKADPLQYGTDVLNRGMIAGLAGAPVDMTNEVLKQFGLGSEKPFGGSESIGSGMESMGMVSPERHMVGELGAGLVDPFSSAATGAKLAHGMTAMMPLMTAYHGSPHVFSAFDASKIGTGEGAQAYGHGLYLAESPDVARVYSADRGYVGAALQGKPKSINYDDPEWIAQKTIDEFGDRQKALEHLQMVQRTSSKHQPPETKAAVQGALDLIASGGVAPKGSLYTVDLPDEHIEKMLDWDKPMSEAEMINIYDKMQQTPLANFARVLQDNFYQRMEKNHPSIDGQDLLMALTKELGGQKQASQALRELGIPGIKYLDQSSRSKGTGTRNFVVFPGEEDKLKILTRNGVPVNP
jgi:hypothetical protein